MRKSFVGACALVVVVFSAVRCAKSSAPAGTATNSLSSVMGAFALSSPLAQRAASRSTYGAGGLKDMASAKKEVTDILGATTVQDCVKGAFALPASPGNPTCYGPSLTYQNHPDGYSSSAFHDGSNCPGASNACFPGGDLGIWTSTEASGEACSAAKMNQVVQTVTDRVNAAQKVFAAALCILNLKGKTTADIADALDFKADLAADVSAATVTTASVDTIATRAGTLATYQLDVVATVSGNVFDVHLIHSPVTADNSTFKGHIYGKIGSSPVTAFSMTYEQDATNLNAELRSGEMTDKSDTAFDTNNDVDYAQTTFVGHGVYYHHILLNKSDGTGTALSAWQATPMDDKTRTFQAKTTAGTPDTGFAHFGFGPKITTSTDRGAIERMICNWAGPGNSHSTGTGKAQGQSMQRNATTGVFEPVTNKITYAPTTSCDYDGTGPDAGNKFKVGSNGTSAPTDFAATTNNLISLTTSATEYTSSLGTIAIPAAPSY